MPSGKTELKVSFLAEEFPNCHTKMLRISSTQETRSEQTVLLAVSLTSKGLSQPIPSWAGPSREARAFLKAARRNPSYPQHEFSKFNPSSLEIWEHLTTFCTWRDPRTRHTALAPGRSWFSSSLEARAAPLMPCQRWPPVRKPRMSHATSRRNWPICIETFRWNDGIFLPALQSPFVRSNSPWLHAARQAIQQRGSKHTWQTWRGSANPGFALKTEAGGYEGTERIMWEEHHKCSSGFSLTCMNSSWHWGLLLFTRLELWAQSLYHVCTISSNIL